MTGIKLVAFLALASTAYADIVLENEEVVQEEIFDLKYAMDSGVGKEMRNATKYYCVFRSLWTEEDHPNHYPDLARYDTPVIFSHTMQYTPFLKNRDANYGVEVLAEEGFTTKFKEQITQAGAYVKDYQEGTGFYISKNNNKNFKYLPPVQVSQQHPYLSGLAGFDPSPDWFTGFYLMNTVDEYAREFWQEFKIQTYPWDAGTDGGELYEDIDYEMEEPEAVQRITAQNAPNGVFVSPLGDEVLPVAEWQCVLHTCPTDNDECEKPDWPPSNGCDILKYPECNSQCDPNSEEEIACERCKRQSNDDPEQVWYSDCCLAGYEPINGMSCEGSGARELSSALVAMVASLLIAALF